MMTNDFSYYDSPKLTFKKCIKFPEGLNHMNQA